MKASHKRLALAASAVAAVAALSACHDDDHHAAATPAGTAPTEFSTFATQTFALGENTPPVNYDQVTFDFDADNNPAAFDALLM
jgi:hypothetical protein